MLKKFIGNKAFYTAAAVLILPMIVQQGITQFVNLLDNVMVGQLGELPLAGVSIVNQIVFIFNLTIFGGLSGASIFGAQFYGKGDEKGVQDTFRFRLYFSLLMCIAGIAVFLCFGDPLFNLFLNKDASSAADIAATLGYAKEYMYISLFGFLPFVIVQSFSSVLRDVGETVSPMVASIIAILLNLLLNYLLIFGSFGFPKMGVAGAALATVIARWVEMLYLVIITCRHKYKYVFMNGLFSSFRVPVQIIKSIAKTGTPLLLNETLWAVGTSLIMACYASRGIIAVTACTIESTVWNLFSIVMMAMGNAIGIISGQKLGANDVEGAKDSVRKLLALNIVVNLIIGLLIMASAPLIQYIYNVGTDVRELATMLIIIAGAFMPLSAYMHSTYFVIRSGGRTVITFLFDCGFTWGVALPIAYILSNYTDISVILMFTFVMSADIIKGIVGGIMLKSGIWIHNVVDKHSSAV